MSEEVVKSEPDIELESRRAKVISLYSKGQSQAEIATKLGVNQSTVSRDLNEIRKQSRKTVEEHVVKDALFEYYRWAATVDEVTKKAWEIAEDEKASQKSKIEALAFLMNCYNKRLEAMVGGPASGYDAQHHVEDIWAQRRVYMKKKYRGSYVYKD